MSILNGIATKRLEFIKAWKVWPEVIVIAESDLDEIIESLPIGFGTLFGMEVDYGDKTECKFKDRVKTADNYKSRGLEA